MRRITIVLLASALAGAGCGRSEDRPAAQAGAAAEADQEEREVAGCDLVTSDELAAAVGSPVAAGEEFGLAGCSWKAESGAQLSLEVYAGSAMVAATCDAQKFLVSGRQEEIPGLGNTALWGSSGDLVVCSPKAVLKVGVDNTPNSPDEDREVAVKIAKAALSRL